MLKQQEQKAQGRTPGPSYDGVFICQSVSIQPSIWKWDCSSGSKSGDPISCNPFQGSGNSISVSSEPKTLILLDEGTDGAKTLEDLVLFLSIHFLAPDAGAVT